MKRGDLVLVPFPFTDLSSTKNRPALILTATDKDITLSFITTQTKWAGQEDVYLTPTSQNGLKKKSVIRLAKITTLEKNLVLGKLGKLSEKKVNEVNDKLKILFNLD
ncbi:MAG TPA: type II toxin-antitoxin system PemK/MazF family toxin [Balneolaceae bacterium]